MKKEINKKTAKNTTAVGFSDEERAAMKEYVAEKRAQASGENGESLLLAKISEMPEPDKKMAKKLHEIMKKAAPSLIPKTWYGMPAYANKEGKVVCFFQGGYKFKARYATLGFSDIAKLDEGNMWPTSYALMKLDDEEEKKIVVLVKKALE